MATQGVTGHFSTGVRSKRSITNVSSGTLRAITFKPRYFSIAPAEGPENWPGMTHLTGSPGILRVASEERENSLRSSVQRIFDA